jgi:hypothetical protein
LNWKKKKKRKNDDDDGGVSQRKSTELQKMSKATWVGKRGERRKRKKLTVIEEGWKIES